jgi:Putative beta-lactamase-inhibitor-like, PepSY-like
MRRYVVLLGASALFLVIGTAEVRSQEEAVPKNKIPKAVMDALLVKFPKAKIDKCTKDKEGDDVVYDIEFKQEGRNCEADIKENGIYINFEKAIAAKDLPRAVSDAIEKKYPNATLNEIMEETEVKGKVEKLSAYEVVLVTADKKDVEVRLSPVGKILEDTGAKTPGEKK